MCPRMKAAGADVVVVSCHSGADTSSSYGDALPYPENAEHAARRSRCPASTRSSSATRTSRSRSATSRTRRPASRCCSASPTTGACGSRVMDLDLSRSAASGRSPRSAATLLNANTAPEDAADRRARAARRTRRCSPTSTASIGTCTQAMSAATSRYEDTAAIDFINYVQADAVKTALAGTATRPAGAVDRGAVQQAAAIPAGDVTVRDVAGLYIYDNTLLGIAFTGAQVKAYLENSAAYFKQVTGTGPFPAAAVTNAVTPTAPNGTPDYNYDIMGGLDAAAHLRHRHLASRSGRGSRTSRTRRAGRRRRPVRRRDQQLPAVRRRRLPGRHDGAGRLQRAGRDPPAADRLGDRRTRSSTRRRSPRVDWRLVARDADHRSRLTGSVIV